MVAMNYLIAAFALAVTLGGNAFTVEICWVLSLEFSPQNLSRIDDNRHLIATPAKTK